MSIHEKAIVSKNATIDPSAEIGPNVIIEEGVDIRSGVRIMANAYLCKGTTVGEGTVIHMGAVIGHAPQDYAYKNTESFTVIGENNVIREHVTIHRGTGEGTSTVIGNNNFIMVQAHIGHNCLIGDNIAIANGALLAGYVKVGSGAFISGNVVFHQYCRIGEYAMIGGFTGVNKDVPPYMTVRGPSVIRGINLVGLRRSGMPRESIREIKEAYKLLFLSDLSQEDAIGKMGDFHSPEIQSLISFIKESKRGICKYRYEREEYF